MTKTIIVSNRLPIEFKITCEKIDNLSDCDTCELPEYKIDIKQSVGGLATGLKSIHEQGNSIWIGWSGLTEEQLTPAQQIFVTEAAAKENCASVALTEKDVNDFYLGFSNKSLWPLFHYFLEFTEYDPEQWKAYVAVNRKFADLVLKHAVEGDTIWVHDYQLLLLPAMLRESNPELSIGFFLHIPFPGFEIFRTCPWREELLEGILGADLIGFHTYDYVQNFLHSVKRIAGYPVKFNEIAVKHRTIKADSFPMGIDYDRFHNAALKHQLRTSREKSELMCRLNEHEINDPESKLILSIDRMDYTKGIPNRIKAFEYFLEKYPQHLGKVRLVMLAVPSRSEVLQYSMLKKETDELVGRINGKIANIGWTPIWYFYRSMPFEDLVALYSFSHVALITPLRDGMNLVAKEYVATRTQEDGVIILSEMAGAASEMQEAILINPNSFNQFADALHEALEMDTTEQARRIKALQKRLSRYTVEKWAMDFMKALHESEHTSHEAFVTKRLDITLQQRIYHDFNAASKRLLLLDYDGTLVGFRSNPDDAAPDQELYELLDTLNEDPQTEIAIISGRGRESIERWFSDKNYTLITDHGIWMRKTGETWEHLEDPKTEWKEIIRPIMESFVDRTPGAFIEEKEYSLAFHFRKADSEMSEVRMWELKNLLTGMVSENGLSVLDGHKVLEVKNSIVNKGRATARLLADHPADFIFAAGDDYTDEFMFEALPESAHSVKIGRMETLAKYSLRDTAELRKVLVGFQR